MEKKSLTRRGFLKLAGLAAGAALSGCTKTVEVEKVVKETVQVEKVVKETVVVATEFKEVVLGRRGWMEAEMPFDQQVAAYNALPEREEDRVRVSLDPAVVACLDPVLSEMMAAGDYIPWNTINGATPWLDTAQMLSMGTVQPWDPYFETTRYQAQKDQLLGPDMIESVRQDSMYEGQMWMFPLQIDMMLLSYRRDWLRELGLDAVPKTMDDLFEVAKEFQDKKKDQGVFGFGPCISCTYCYMSALHQAYSPQDSLYDSDGLINVRDAGWLEAMAWTKKVIDAGLSPKGWETDCFDNMMNEGKLGMKLSTNGSAARAGRLLGFRNAWMAGIPIGNANRVQQSGTMFWATGVPLYKAAPYPQETTDFFMWAMDPQNKPMGQGIWKTGKMAPWHSYYGEDFINPNDATVSWALEILPLLEAARPASKNPWFLAFDKRISVQMVSYLNGEKSAEQAMADAYAGLEEDISKGEFTKGGYKS